MALRSSSSRTRSRTKCATWSGGTNSRTDGGSSQSWSTSQGRKVALMTVLTHSAGSLSIPWAGFVHRLLGADPTNAANWTVTTIAGTGATGHAPGAGNNATMDLPFAI